MDSPLSTTFGVRINLFLTSANDYHNQRKRINKRLGKLRKELKIHTRDTKNYKSKEKQSKVTSVDYNSNPKYGLLFLYNIERDIIHALETKTVLEVQSSKSKEVFIRSKYKKSLINCKKLLEIIKDEKNLFIKLEFLIYAAIVFGSYAVFKKNWNDSIYSYSIARIGLQFLDKASSDKNSKYNISNKEIFVEMIDTIVDPSLKLSLYHINGASLSATPDLNNIARLHINDNTIPCLKELVDIVNSKDAAFTKAEDKMSIDLLKKIQWSKYSADIRSEDTSRLLMFAQAKTLPHFVNVSSYDPALLAWQEVLEHHSTEMEKTNDLTDEEIEDNQVILAYIKYQLIFLKIRRDLTLIEELSIKQKKNLSKNFVLLKNKDILRILENILRAVQELKDLPGVYNNEEMWKALETIESYYQIIKITKLAESYLTSRKLKESLALLSKANQLCNFLESTDVIDHINIPNLPISKDVETLKLEVERNLNKVHILCNYFESRKTSDDFLINNINKFIGGSADETLNKVVNMENNFEPIHVKPVLFDIAFNYITYDDDTNKNEQREVQRGANEEESNKAKKGFFGLFGGGR